MAGIIPPEIVEQVRNASDIVDVIGGYVPLKKSGAKFKALSPFNKEKTPSFYVDPAKQIFKCFSSGHGGDVFKFLMLMENMSFPEAIRRLAQRAGIVIPESSGTHDPLARSRREELLALNAAVASWWQKLLHSDAAAEPARAYLKSREFPSDLADEFGLGYAPEGWDTTLKWAQKNGHSMATLEAGRLVATSESGRTFDFFRGRLMIPIYNDAGEVVAFSGRLLDPEAKAQKYVNSHETPVFIKSKILFGLNKSKRPIIEAGSAIVCEGQIDLMRCWQNGIRNIVASQGTAFTDPHARILKRIAKEVVICFDADRAGQNASLKSIDVLLKEDLQVRVARIPQGEDPDSLLRKQPVEVFETILREAKDYTRHLLDSACEQEDVSSPRGRGAVAAKIAAVIAKIPNAVQREGFLLEVARRLQVSRAILEEEVRKAETQIRRTELQQKNYAATANSTADESEAASAEAAPPEPIHGSPIVEALLSLLLTNPEMAPTVSRQLDPKWLEGLGAGEVILQVLDAHAHDAFETATQFMEECDDRTRNYLSGLLFEPPPIPTETSPEAYADKLVRNLEKRWKQQRLQMLNLAVKSDELAVEERMKYLMEIQVIRRQFPDLEP
jgi:DNA primase